ncbi:endonuclease/exonuclease/phosphatase family metal-dependent hydrolase [Thermocatellispora tengchongensis]|uniref:Endonuclease/exonuclease/phosphatase family metal-dependent hydrolase n=1 Tax=Thermocatellispora tengchongensis TaxID=1073253 RepID=A0A840PA05_9ACTN|nr:endonuclease/exonuclease/phosphatase family protein [Thermocatellispora tengchongensis]MBB5138214.1 endonuclease/exonuclease/phosphatase family metal-dependent hydrolase [Thermocatellispora tengchongensis]
MQIRPHVSATPLVAVLAALMLELLRMSGPMIDAAPGGAAGRALAGLAVFAAPVLAWPLGRALGARAVPVAVAALAAGRVALQAFGAPPVALGLAVVALGLAALVLAVSAAEGGAGATGLLCGVALDVAVRSLSGTWDVIWQSGWAPWLITAAECAAATAIAWWTHRRLPAGRPSGPRAWVIGPFLGLAVPFLASPAFPAAQAGVPVALASVVLILGALFAVVAAGEARHATALGGRAPVAVAAVLLAAALPAALLTTGRHVLAAVVVALVAAGLLLARALEDTGTARERPTEPGWAGLAAGLGFLATVLPYQLGDDLPLWVPDAAWPLAGVAVLALTGVRRAPAEAAGPLTHEFGLVGGCALALLAPVIALVTTPAPVPKQQPARGQVKLLTWNVHHGVTGQARVDPEAVARTIERSDPDVILLQEVGRGWPAGGGLDLAEWLSRRLRLDYVWAPAGGGRSGNLIMSKAPLTDTRTGRLPYGAGPARRSYAAATVRVPGGGLRVMTTHLRHREEDDPTRLRQIGSLLRERSRPAVIAGDLGFKPTWPDEQRLFEDAGFTSAQAQPGPGGRMTYPAGLPKDRVDWIWASEGVRFHDVAVLQGVTVSDHLPLEATLTLPAS